MPELSHPTRVRELKQPLPVRPPLEVCCRTPRGCVVETETLRELVGGQGRTPRGCVG